jgi:hypothetical protein
MLNTKIRLRYDSYANWSTNNPTLLAGEVALVVPGNKLGTVDTVADCLMKVGDGTTAFNSLPWLSAVAADVHSWAKLSLADFSAWILGTKTIDGLTRPALATDAQVKKVASDLSALDTRVEAAEGKITTLEGEMDTAQQDITNLKAAVGTGADGLATKVEDLTTRLGTAEGEIDGLQTGLEGANSNISINAGNITKNTNAIATLNGADTVEGSVAHAVKVEADRAKLAEQANANAITEITKENGTIDTKVAAGVQAETNRAESAESALGTRIDGVKTTADNADTLSKENKSRLDTLIGADANKSVRTIAADEINTLIGGVSDEDTIENITSLINYVNENGGDIAALEKTVSDHTNDLSAQSGKITTLETKMTNAQGDITTINNKIGEVELPTTAKTLTGAIAETHAKIATDDATTLQSAKDYADQVVAGLSTGSGALAALESRVAINEGKLSDVDAGAKVGALITAAQEAAATDATNKANQAKADAIAAAATDAQTKANQALTDAKAYTNTKIGEVESAMSAHTGKALTGVIADGAMTMSLGDSVLDLVIYCGNSAN